MSSVAALHPDAVAFLQLIERPGSPPFHELPLETQRTASEKMMFGFRLPPPDVAVAVERNMERAEAEGGPLRCRIYRPLGSNHADHRLPALVWYHGGGCVVGNIESYDSLCREIANRAGCAVVSCAYRLAPEHPFPAAVDDAWFALRWVAAHAGELGIDAARLAVGGDSAGGYLSIVTALRARDGGLPLRFQLLIYPGTDQRMQTDSHRRYATGYLLTQTTMRHFVDCYLPDAADRLDWRASPVLAPTLAGLPPALVLTASHDPIVDDCRAYAERLEADGVPVRYSEYAGLIHGFFALGKAFGAAKAAMEEATAALREALA